MTSEQITNALSRLRLMRHARATTAKPAEDGSLVPMLTASAEVCAIDLAVAALEEKLKEGAH